MSRPRWEPVRSEVAGFEDWTVERAIDPPEWRGGRTYKSDVLCEVYTTPPRYGEPGRTAEENAIRIAAAMNRLEEEAES